MRIGRYELGDEVARGGLAAVHLGAMRADGGFVRVVAIKRLHAQYARDPSFVAMLRDEARLSAKVRDPHVVPTLEILQDDDELLVVMDYVVGATMAELIVAARRQHHAIPPPLVAALVRDALLGLHAAHVTADPTGQPLGIVHRDVSPQNVILGDDGVARVLDFGVAKARARSYRTEDGTVRGKLGYMAPEQLYGEEVDARTDVFGAGVLLWEALCSERLFVGPDGEPALAAVLEREVTPPTRVRHGVPQAFDDIVARALASSPIDRFPSAMAMATAIEQAVEVAPPRALTRWLEDTVGTLVESRRSDVARMEQTGVGGTEAHTAVSTDDPSPRRISPYLGAALGAALAVGAGWWLRGAPIEQPARPAWMPLDALSPPASTATSTAAAVTTTSAPEKPPIPDPPPRPRLRAKPAMPPLPPGSCDPPYFIDDRGHKRYKRACLR